MMAAALLGSSLMMAVPGLAADGVVDHPARYSACVGPAAASGGFTDMVGHTFEVEVNCLAYYKIALGTAPGIFSPDQKVTRVQMARFLSRAAAIAGIPLPPPTDQGFRDLEGISPRTRDAINVMAILEIMDGYTFSEFRPYVYVTRQDMAAHLDGFLQVSEPGPGSVDIGDVRPDDNVFDDLDSVLGFAYQPILRMYELGITNGTTPNTFSPNGLVTRGQAAAFITRTLSHTNLRPAGVTIQVDAHEVHDDGDMNILVSIRDSQFQPVWDEYVDVFSATDPDRAFNSAGACTNHPQAVSADDPCVIDGAEELTDSDGNATLSVVPGDEPETFWAWTGDEGDEFDEDRTDFARIDAGAITLVVAIKVTDDMKDTAEMLRFGEDVTFRFQLVDAEGAATLLAGVEIDLIARTVRPDNRRVTERVTLVTDGSGRVEWTYAGPTDPSPSTDDSSVLDLDARSDYSFDDQTTLELLVPPSDRSDRDLEWSDSDSRATTLVVRLADGVYKEASDKGSGVANLVRAVLTDQYGDPLDGERITFYSDDPLGLPFGKTRTTNSRGMASLSYRRDSAISGTERIWAELREGRPRSNRVSHYWALAADDGDRGGGTVVVADTTNNVVLVRSVGTVTLLEYDRNDHFFMQESGDDPYRAVTMADFEEALDSGDALTFSITDTSSSEVNVFRLTSPPS